MPRPSKGPRLYLHPKERVWLIRDGEVTRRTGCGEADREGAEQELGAYIAEKFKPVTRESDLHKVTIAEVLTAYGREHAPGKKSAETIGYCIVNLVDWWKARTLADVHMGTCRQYAEHRSQKVGDWRIRGELGVLSAAIGYWHAAHGPLTAVPEVTLPAKPDGRHRWLTRSEAAMLLAGALGFYRVYASDVQTRRVNMKWERYRLAVNRHLARLITIGLYTGTRRGAIFGLQWMPNTTGGWVDLDRGVMYRRGRGVTETNKRQPPTRLGKRLRLHSARWKRIDEAARAAVTSDWVAAGGDPTTAPAVFLHMVSWRGQAVGSVRRAWDMAVDLAWLAPEHTGDDRVTPHILRHTRATWLMQRGVDMWEAAGSLGMSVKMLQDNYGHHHPDWQKNAAEV